MTKLICAGNLRRAWGERSGAGMLLFLFFKSEFRVYDSELICGRREARGRLLLFSFLKSGFQIYDFQFSKFRISVASGWSI